MTATIYAVLRRPGPVTDDGPTWRRLRVRLERIEEINREQLLETLERRRKRYSQFLPEARIVATVSARAFR